MKQQETCASLPLEQEIWALIPVLFQLRISVQAGS